MGKCFVTYENNLDIDVVEWSAKGPYRFYFNEAYDPNTLTFIEPPSVAKEIGNSVVEIENEHIFPEWQTIERPLRMMDVFAGCGGRNNRFHEPFFIMLLLFF